MSFAGGTGSTRFRSFALLRLIAAYSRALVGSYLVNAGFNQIYTMIDDASAVEPLRKVWRNGWGFGGMRRRLLARAADATQVHSIISVIEVTETRLSFRLSSVSASFVCKPTRFQHTRANMTTSQTPSSITERRLAIAHRLCEALVGQDPDRAITLCDSGGRVVTHHNPKLEQSSPETA
jgi:hypothetical protein